MATPTKLSHVVFQTNQIAAMRDWYRLMLGAEVVYENPRICFISYDPEHHRVAFIDPGPLSPRSGAGSEARPRSGFHHAAFAFGALGELLETYQRGKERGIVPEWCVNHGLTTSMYYRDPDGNRTELFVENFLTLAECTAYMKSPAFANNPVGVNYDPDDLLVRFQAGVPVRELIAMP